MTTKYKIITGFGLLMALVAALVFMGYRTAQRSSDDFDEYRRLARLNVGMSDAALNLNGAASELYAFMRSRSPKDMEDSQAHAATTLEALKSAEPFARSDATKAIFSELQTDMGTFMGMQKQVNENMLGITNLYAEVVLPSAKNCMDSLADLARQAQDLGNVDALGQISIVWHKLVTAMSSVSRFANTVSAEDAQTVRTSFDEVIKEVDTLDPLLTSDIGRRTLAVFVDSENKLKDALTRMDQQGSEVRKSLESIYGIIAEATGKADAFNVDIDSRMTTRGTLTLEENENTRRIVLVTGLVGLIAGTVIALFIVLGIIRVLKDLSGYAGAVARGDFAYQLKVREKGEIGGMVEAMRNIPAVLENIIHTANDLATSIRAGKMRDRLNSAELPGEFASLGNAVNTVSDAYTDMLDAIPLPVMACDTTYNVLFYNKPGQEVAGGDLVNTQCKANLNANVCGTDKCFGKQAMETGKTVSGETEVMVHGEQRYIAITAIPLQDNDSKICGYFEVITDLTEIRQQQATMMQVAKQATEISDRVAAASEELAAQVEQISRGAEIQRDRVTSTASAMAEMNATVLEVARSAGEASSKSDDTRSKADSGAHLVNQVVESINTVNTVATGLQNNMQELGVQAEGIGGVMNVISDIADQTNLLALNAAIEAARAGEAGRGFAVVADEVRKLAEKTMEATREVGDNITAIQHSARLNMDEVEKAVASVGTATKLADESGLALQEIVSIASDNSQVVASIATAAEQQSATSEEINQSVDEINRVVGETTEGMVQSSAAVQELSRMAQELKHVMEGLR